MTTVVAPDLVALYRARPNVVDFVDVPLLGYLAVDGQGTPGGDAFAAALRALYSVAYGAHFAAKRRLGVAAKVMPLEALWWQDGVSVTPGPTWRWRLLLAQPDPVDERDIAAALDATRAKAVNPALDGVRYLRWEEGHCVQVLHVGPYDAEAPTLARLEAAAHAAGYRLCGDHHEIYLGDPRRCAPERLRTILRHPVAAR